MRKCFFKCWAQRLTKSKAKRDGVFLGFWTPGYPPKIDNQDRKRISYQVPSLSLPVPWNLTRCFSVLQFSSLKSAWPCIPIILFGCCFKTCSLFLPRPAWVAVLSFSPPYNSIPFSVSSRPVELTPRPYPSYFSFTFRWAQLLWPRNELCFTCFTRDFPSAS